MKKILVWVLVFVAFILAGCQEKKGTEEPMTEEAIIEANKKFFMESFDVEEYFAQNYAEAFSEHGSQVLKGFVIEEEDEDGSIVRTVDSAGQYYYLIVSSSGDLSAAYKGEIAESEPIWAFRDEVIIDPKLINPSVTE